ncbi:MAG: hypothetical protein M1161_04155 [Candidatus Thermoplasmatota archaeon]|jgi:hypothetical protein|nr:hypothetical protein [Candidatus Thermoplasmatota archaeon]
MYSGLVYVGIAVIVASLHMIAPDHWLPLTALSLKRGYKKRRVLGISTLLGFLHGSTSVVLSLFALFLGVSIFGLNALKEVSIVVLVVVAIYILVNTIREGRENKNIENTSLLVSIFPDPVLLPIIIASFHFGSTEIAAISITFVITSVVALLIVLAVVMKGVARSLSRLKPSTVDVFVVAALFLTAIYIFFFG